MSRAAPLLVTLFLLVTLAASATAWGQLGHSTVATIAYNNLSPKAKRPVEGRLPAIIAVLPPNCKNGGCVITAIATNARDLAINKDNPKAAWQALANLVHYVGDVTCPMHITGYAAARNGNLHSAWDGVILDMTVRKYFGGNQDAWMNHVVELTGYKVRDFVGREPRPTFAPSFMAQFQVNGKIEGAYHDGVRDLADMQLAKAGARLGALLNKVLGGQ
ncbi:phospholipase C/P1 nuclease domain-containing protein [Catenaria anguillulae PL171]|uniref:Phospholipase C/P1 nuclease domain-containing protein n=1 Tax=Catenaria anguillulae PL171 TaxID=765915 RepID=A0A1Y2I1Z3_9FUNG|nr:phospholipase C/P1 nuclease domain-containing protein [Catenaria anguillulae PL171]